MVVKDLIRIDKIQKELNNVFEKFNESLFGNFKRPSINISQNSNFVLINIDMPGVEKDEINLKINHNSLEVLTERKKKIAKKNEEETSYKGYSANVGLPPHLDIDELKAEYKNGTLKINIPKMKTRIGSRINIS